MERFLTLFEKEPPFAPGAMLTIKFMKNKSSSNMF